MLTQVRADLRRHAPMVGKTLTVLLTGANAFIGRHFVRRLARDGHRIVAVTRSSFLTEPPASVRPIVADLQDRDALDDVGGITFDCIVHVAATSPQPGVTAAAMCGDNALATTNLVEWACRQRVRKFIYLSSLAVHGRIVEPVVGADTGFCDPDAYGLTKRVGEIVLSEAADSIASVSIRLPGILGPEASRIWLSDVKRRLLAQEDVAIFNPDSPFNNAVHVSDLSDFVAGLATRELAGAAAFPVGADGHLTIRKVVGTLKEAMHSRSAIRVATRRAPGFTIDNNAALRFGYEPRPIADVLTMYAQDPLRHHAV